ncbi:hypothetical protein RIDGECB_78 [Mycobacterium phage RidgeCB]|uniref:Uncharacterized protein n=1 Tax=Mycobacterium phage RidgeCB TaxID=1071506 RepID=G1JTX8_9CAUD|nr:hypothetical protein RIDGECB_78 [Mycobacterium phage RidgeCB]AEL20150.1 hypothetical protein RIDGECB_78 [Mycobacterium phage RidgeCB]
MATELKAAMRKLIAGKGRKMEDHDDPSIYGWTDYKNLRSLGYAEGWLR